MKKGFTLIELLAVIAIMAIILLIAVPVYNGVQTNIKESIYHSKIEEVLAKAEGYASETNSFVFDIKTLIENGSLSADNEAGSFVDPRTNRDMRCDIVNVVYENNQYEASITESETCYEQEELENLFGMVDLVLYKSDGSEINKIEGTDWIKERNIYVGYRFKEAYQSYQDKITEIYWSGEEEKSCQEDLSTCEKYEIVTDQIKNVTIHLEMVFVIDGVEIRSNTSKTILVDLQKPSVVEGSVNVNNDINTSQERKVEFEISDGAGSGIKSYSIVKTKSCNTEEYEKNKTSASEGIQSVYLTNGNYYICVEDKVGNKTEDSDLENPKNQIHVENVDTSVPVISQFEIKSVNGSYNTLDTVLTINASDDGGTNNLKMCISNTGYLQGCNWENYATSKNWKVSGNLDGTSKTVYLSIQDGAGNIVHREGKYTVYKECTTQTKVYTDSAYGTCSKSCGGGVQYRNYQMKDSYTGKVCKTDKDSKTCNTQSCAPTITLIGTYNFTTIAPLNSTQAVGITADELTWTNDLPSYWQYNYSYINAQVINVNANNQVSIGGVNGITYGYDALGAAGIRVAKINDNKLLLVGKSYYKHHTQTGDGRMGAVMIEVNGNSAWASGKVILYDDMKWYNLLPSQIIYYQGNAEAQITIEANSSSGKVHTYTFNYNVNNGSFYEVSDKTWNRKSNLYWSTDRESLIEPPYTGTSYSRSIRAFTPLDRNNKVWVGFNWATSDTTGIYIGPAGADYTGNDYLVFPVDTYEDQYGEIVELSHFGTSKFIARTGANSGTNRKKNFLFYRNINGTWKLEHTIAISDSMGSYGTLVPLNDKQMLYYSGATTTNRNLYLIQYNT